MLLAHAMELSTYISTETSENKLRSLQLPTYLISLINALYFFLKQTSGLEIDVPWLSSSSNIYLLENIIFGKLSKSQAHAV